jgi:FixJ family two-component response regulator
MQLARTVHIIEDDDSSRRFLSRRLQAHGYAVRTYPSASAFLAAEVESGPGCILVEAGLRGMSGLDLQRAMVSRPEHLPIIFISDSSESDIQTAVQAMKAGAVDFLTKHAPHKVLINAIQTALARSERDWITREEARSRRACYERLTKRQQEVFQRVVVGKPNKEIATELGVALRTIKAHRAEAMKKLHVTSVAGLVRFANQLSVLA